MAASTGMDFRLHCPAKKPDVFILGSAPGARGLTAAALGDAKTLGKDAGTRLKGLTGLPVRRVLHPSEGRRIDRQWDYFERLRDRQPMTKFHLAFSTAPGEAFMVYRLKPFDSRWEGFRVLRAGVAVPPTLSTYNSWIYASDGITDWRVEFETDAPQWVDVHVF